MQDERVPDRFGTPAVAPSAKAAARRGGLREGDGGAVAGQRAAGGQHRRRFGAGRGDGLPLCPGLAAPGAGKVPGPRSARLLGAAALGGAGRPEPGTGPDLVHRRAGRWGVAAALLGRGLFGFGPDAVAAPARVQLQAHHARALRGRPCAPSRLPGRGVASPAGAGPSRAGGGVLRRRGPPHPQHAFHAGLDARARPGRCPRSAGASG